MNKYGLDQITEWPHKIPFRGAKESTIRSQASRLGYKVAKDNFNKEFIITINTDELDNIEIDGIDHSDAPDYSDAFLSSADLKGEKLDDIALDYLQGLDWFGAYLLEYVSGMV